MTLAKLLVAGNSIVNGREEISYRANKHVYLPRFSAGRNPFQTPARTETPVSRTSSVIMPVSRRLVAEPEQAPVQTSLIPVMVPTVAAVPVSVSAPASLPASMPAPVIPAPVAAEPPAPEAAKTQKIPFCPPRPARRTSWLGKLNPLALWRGRRAKAKGVQPTVQPEFSLNDVRVVHNDLSDADVEVVPIKSHVSSETTVPNLPPPNRPWDYLAERMFGNKLD